MIFPGENTIFCKIHVFCFEVEIDGKHEKNENKSLENQLFFGRRFLKDFEPTWLDFGLQVGPQQICSTQAFSKLRPRVVQDVPKSAPSASQERPRVPRERPKGTQERPKSSPRVPKSALRASLERPRGSQERPRVREFRNMLQTG